MRILLAPNALKGSLSAAKAAAAIKRALSPRHDVTTFPISDGGDGFIDFFRMLDPQSHLISVTAKNAFHKTKRTSFLLLSDGETAVLETARICGLGSAKANELDPLGASSYGVGEVLSKAISRGARTIYVGLGGVACSDGGAGMAVACGARLYDKKGVPLALGANALLQLARIDLSLLQKNIKGVKIIGIADVTNPLLGIKGSAKIFGPQKGATPKQVCLLDKALSCWAKHLVQAQARSPITIPGAAAAGAIGAGLYSCFKAPLLLGADFLIQKTPLSSLIKDCDMVITCEGKLDEQTFYGKAPMAVLRLAKKHKKQTLFICGQCTLKRFPKKFPFQLAVLTDFATNVQDAKNRAARYLTRVCKNL